MSLLRTLSLVATDRVIEDDMRSAKVQRGFLDFAVDGAPFYPVIRSVGFDYVTALWIDSPQNAGAAIKRLLGEEPGDAPGGRVALYVCPECADLGCGAVTVRLVVEGGIVTWDDWGYQNNYEEIHREDGLSLLGPATFEGSQYEAVLRSALA